MLEDSRVLEGSENRYIGTGKRTRAAESSTMHKGSKVYRGSIMQQGEREREKREKIQILIKYYSNVTISSSYIRTTLLVLEERAGVLSQAPAETAAPKNFDGRLRARPRLCGSRPRGRTLAWWRPAAGLDL